MSNHEQLVQALVSQNFYFFLRKTFRTLYPTQELQTAQYLEALCFALQAAAKDEGSRLLVTIPPRHLKSTCASVALPAFLLARDPSTEIMVATYNQEFAVLHSNQFRKLVESDWYRRYFPETQISSRDNRSDEIRTTAEGSRKAVSVTGGSTGRGGDVIIIDDLMKAADVHSEVSRRAAQIFYEETLVGRLNQKRSASIIAIQQRLHEDDVAGYLIEKGTYRLLSLPAIAIENEELALYEQRTFKRLRGEALSPEREDVATLQKLRAEITEPVFSAQYQQEPVPPGNADVIFEKIATVESPPSRQACVTCH